MDKIYEEYFPKIYYWSLKKTDNKEDAEDLTNSIFVALFEYDNLSNQVQHSHKYSLNNSCGVL